MGTILGQYYLIGSALNVRIRMYAPPLGCARLGGMQTFAPLLGEVEEFLRIARTIPRYSDLKITLNARDPGVKKTYVEKVAGLVFPSFQRIHKMAKRTDSLSRERFASI
jgi:hypothetical protein